MPGRSGGRYGQSTEDRESDRRAEFYETHSTYDKKVKGTWVVVREGPTGMKGRHSGKLSYADAVKEKRRLQGDEDKMGSLAGHYTVKKISKRKP